MRAFINVNLLVERRHAEHPTEIADLCGSRAVFSVEVGAQARLDEARIKDLTGGDPNRLVELRPEFTVVWNRCCWALYGSWDSATGVVAITLTTPGADQGLRQVFGTGLVLPPRRP